MSDTRIRALGSNAKEIVYNVSEHVIGKEGDRSYLEKTAEMTGVSKATISRIRKEKRDTGVLGSPTRMKRGPYKGLDDFDKAVIRNKFVEFYTVRKQLPTLSMLHATLVQDIQFPGSVETLRMLVKQMGYKWRKTRDNRKVLIERPNVVAQRLAFYKKKKEFEERGLELVFIDETWVDTSYTSKYCWQGDNTPGTIRPCNRGQRIIVVHAGTKDGFVSGAELIYKARSTTGDYHSEMDGKNFTKWIEEKLIPNLDMPCAIVMDNASYHSMRVDKFPTSNSKKADIQVCVCRSYFGEANRTLFLFVFF